MYVVKLMYFFWYNIVKFEISGIFIMDFFIYLLKYIKYKFILIIYFDYYL